MTTILLMQDEAILVERDKLVKRSEYFRSMFTNFREKEQKTVRIDYQVDTRIFEIFISLITDCQTDKKEVLEYAYDLYHLHLYFQVDNQLFVNLIKENIEKKEVVNSQSLISLFFLSKENPDIFDWKDLLSKTEISDEYLEIKSEIRENDLMQGEYLTIFSHWKENLVSNLKYDCLALLDILSLDLSFQPIETIDVKHPLLDLYSPGDQITIKTIEEFKQKFFEFSHGTIDLDKLNWKNICLSGGSVLANILIREADPNSDIVFWIFRGQEED